MMLTPEFLADVLVRGGRLSDADADQLREEARRQPRGQTTTRTYEQRSAGYELIERLRFADQSDPGRVLDEAAIAGAVAEDAGLEYVRIDPLMLNAELIEAKTSRPFALRHRMLPLDMNQGRLRVACANPHDIEAVDSFRRLVGTNVELVVASEPDILRAITEFYGLRQSVRRAERDLKAGVDLGNLEQLVKLKDEAEIESSDQHIVNAVEFMLQHAFDTRASDIHIEPKRDDSLIRFRIDGVLHDIQTMPKLVHRAVVSRLKTMSRLDIAERRRPQDGRVKTSRRNREVELRVSTLPVAFGEKVVMRIFDPETFMKDLGDLGFNEDDSAKFQSFIQRPHGIVLVTGPDRLGQEHDALQRSGQPRPPRDQRHHDRRSDRDGARGLQPDGRADQGRRDLRQGSPPHPEAGPRHHHGRRDPRPGDGSVRDPGGNDRTISSSPLCTPTMPLRPSPA